MSKQSQEKTYFLLRYGFVARSRGAFVYPTNDQSIWVLTVAGKGAKDRNIPLNDAVLDALKRYRTAMTLSPLSIPGDPDEKALPLVFGPVSSATGKRKSLSVRRLEELIKNLFNQAANKCPKESKMASGFKKAVPHTLRHTAITNLGNAGATLQQQAEFAGHSDPRTTMWYHHEGLGKIHSSVKDMATLY